MCRPVRSIKFMTALARARTAFPVRRPPQGVFHHRMAAVERISATVSTGARSSAYFLFPLLTLDFIMQCFVLFWFIFVFLLSEAVFPGPAPLKPEPKKKKVVKKKDKDDKKGDSLTKPTKPKAASSAEE